MFYSHKCSDFLIWHFEPIFPEIVHIFHGLVVYLQTFPDSMTSSVWVRFAPCLYWQGKLLHIAVTIEIRNHKKTPQFNLELHIFSFIGTYFTSVTLCYISHQDSAAKIC